MELLELVLVEMGERKGWKRYKGMVEMLLMGATVRGWPFDGTRMSALVLMVARENLEARSNVFVVVEVRIDRVK